MYADQQYMCNEIAFGAHPTRDIARRSTDNDIKAGGRFRISLDSYIPDPEVYPCCKATACASRHVLARPLDSRHRWPRWRGSVPGCRAGRSAKWQGEGVVGQAGRRAGGLAGWRASGGPSLSARPRTYPTEVVPSGNVPPCNVALCEAWASVLGRLGFWACLFLPAENNTFSYHM